MRKYKFVGGCFQISLEDGEINLYLTSFTGAVSLTVNDLVEHFHKTNREFVLGLFSGYNMLLDRKTWLVLYNLCKISEKVTTTGKLAMLISSALSDMGYINLSSTRSTLKLLSSIQGSIFGSEIIADPILVNLKSIAVSDMYYYNYSKLNPIIKSNIRIFVDRKHINNTEKSEHILQQISIVLNTQLTNQFVAAGANILDFPNIKRLYMKEITVELLEDTETGN